MADYTTIDDPSAHFQVATYTGNNSSLAITNDGNSNLQPDILWAKNRSNARDHALFNSSLDSTRDFHIVNGQAGEQQSASGKDLVSFDTDGFTLAANQLNVVNNASETYVAWQWKANAGTKVTVAESGSGSGCVNACTHQANTTAGISIILYTGRDDELSNGQESHLTHGLGVAPAFTIMKRRDATADWYVMGKNVTSASAYSNNEYLSINDTDAINGNSYTGDTAPDSTHIFLGNELVNVADALYICYAFAEKQGFSKFGKYVGNSNVNGPFVYLGFQPAFVMIKRQPYGTTYSSWALFDNKRRTYNPAGDTQSLYANRNYQEGKRGEGSSNTSEVRIDILSNGFKVKDGGSDEINDAGDKYSYMAFAQHPFVTSTDTNSIPTTAR